MTNEFLIMFTKLETLFCTTQIPKYQARLLISKKINFITFQKVRLAPSRKKEDNSHTI